MKKKIVISIVAVALVLCCAIGGTLAWLTAQTDSVTNTFTVGDINIDLTETERDYKMVPGDTLAKDPKVTVKANSEDCYLFVKVAESDNLAQFIEYVVANGWTQYEETNVWYREVSASTEDQTFEVLADNRVTVKGDVTKEMMTSSGFTNPTLTFKAAAVQQANMTLENAYTEAMKLLG